MKKKTQKTTTSSFKVPEGLLGASMSQSTSSFGRGQKESSGINYARQSSHAKLIVARSRSRSAERRTIQQQQSDAILQHQLRLDKARQSKQELKQKLERRPGSGLNWKPELTIPETPRIIGVQQRPNEQVYGKKASRSMVRNVVRSTEIS